MKYIKPIILITTGLLCIIVGATCIQHSASTQTTDRMTDDAVMTSLPISSTPTKTPNTTPEPEIEPTLPSRGDTFTPITSYVYQDTRLPMPLSVELQEHTYKMSQKHNVPFKVIMGLLGAESSWDASITTRTNNVGTFVGMGALRDIYHANRFTKHGIDIYTPEGNIEAICILIREKLDIFENNIHYALMAYNWGPNTTKAKIAEGIHQSTYSISVLQYAESFQ